MLKATLLILVIVGVAHIMAMSIDGDGAEKVAKVHAMKNVTRWNKTLTCKGEPFKFSDEMKNSVRSAWKDCISEVFPELKVAAKAEKESADVPTEDLAEENEHMKKWKAIRQNTCLRVCVMKKKGLFAKDGKYEASAFHTAMEQLFPQTVLAQVNGAFDKCAEQIDASLNTEEDACAGYKPFFQCKRKAIFEICEIPERRHHHKNATKEQSN